MTNQARTAVRLPGPDIQASIARFTIGFVEKLEDETIVSRGSGTLVRIGKLAGVLTCSHVIEQIMKATKIGFLCFSVRPEQTQATMIETSLLEPPLSIGSRPWTSDGPDLGFVRLPDRFMPTLEALASVLDLRKQADERDRAGPKGTFQGEVLCGVIAEFAFASTVEEHTSKMIFPGFIVPGQVCALPEIDGYDRLAFHPPNVFDDGTQPHSYAGTSGGSLWRVWVEQSEDGGTRLAERRLLGVPYYETELSPDKSRSIVSHGPQSIYERLLPAIRKRWPL